MALYHFLRRIASSQDHVQTLQKLNNNNKIKYSSDKDRYDFFGGDDKLFIDLVVTSIKNSIMQIQV